MILASSVNIAGEGNISFGGVISGSGGLIVNGPGGVTLSNFNTYTGAGERRHAQSRGGRRNRCDRPRVAVNPSHPSVAGNSLGYYNPGSTSVSAVNVNGATIDIAVNNNVHGYTANFYLTGGTMSTRREAGLSTSPTDTA